MKTHWVTVHHHHYEEQGHFLTWITSLSVLGLECVV